MNNVYIVLAVVVFAAVYFISIYNSLVVLKARIKEAFSGIDVQLKRRADLIPNLVETVKGYASHEKEIFENVTKARSALMSATGVEDKAMANNMLSGALKSLFAVAEAYPDLKASTNFQDLQKQVGDTEDKIAYSRQFYNGNVLQYNTKVQVFPSNIVANMFGFAAEQYFAATEEERKNVQIKF